MVKVARTKKRGRLSTFSASLTTKQIEWLRSHFKPQEALRNAIDTAMQNSLEPLKKKEAELQDMWRLLTSAYQAQGEKGGKRKEELIKRIQATRAKIDEVHKKMDDLKY